MDSSEQDLLSLIVFFFSWIDNCSMMKSYNWISIVLYVLSIGIFVYRPNSRVPHLSARVSDTSLNSPSQKKNFSTSPTSETDSGIVDRTNIAKPRAIALSGTARRSATPKGDSIDNQRISKIFSPRSSSTGRTFRGQKLDMVSFKNERDRKAASELRNARRDEFLALRQSKIQEVYN
jgi:hypothetical protein